MSEIQQNRYDQLFRRVADLKGPGSKVGWAVGDLLATLDVENVPPELLILMGSRLAQGRVRIAAGGVGFFNRIHLTNPVDSGVIARLLEVRISSNSSTSVYQIGVSQNVEAAAGTRAFMDGRVFGEGTTLVTQGNNNLLTAGGGDFEFTLANLGTEVPLHAPYVLSPGSSVQISPQSANVTTIASFLWLERQAQPSELNL